MSDLDETFTDTSDECFLPSDTISRSIRNVHVLQDSRKNHVKTPPVLQVSSWSLGGHGYSWLPWRWCQMGGNIHQKCLWKFYQDLTSGTMSRLHLSSKSLPGVQEDMDLDMVLDGRDHPSKVSVKVSSRSDIRNHVKTAPVFQVSSWSQRGHEHSWWTLRWCQMGANIHQKLLWKFYQDLTTGSMSRLRLSSKSLPGV